MPSSVDEISKSKQSIVRLFVAFVGFSSVLFFAVISLFLIPLVNDSFDALQQKSEAQTLDSYALKFSTYIDGRVLLLNDIASSPLVTNAALIANNTPALADFVNDVRVLGEDPELAVIDINARVLIAENEADNSYGWVQPLLSEGVDSVVRLVESRKTDSGMTTPIFELAVPIIYRNGREGVLVGRINAAPNRIYSEELLLPEESAVRYSLAGKNIASSMELIKSPSEKTAIIEPYGIALTHISSSQEVAERKKYLFFRFLLGAGISAVVMCLALFLIGRKVILQPYIKLAGLQNAVSKAVEGISFIDPSGCYQAVNNAYAGIAGYKPQELEGKQWAITVHPEDLPGLENAYKTMLNDGIVTAEARGINKEGEIFYKQVTLVAEYDDVGELSGHHCFMKDISFRKENEKKQEDLIQALARTNSHLLEEQEKNLLAEKNIRTMFNFQQVVFDNVPDMLFVKDEKFRIVQANKAFLNVYPSDMRNQVIGTTTLESYREDEREAFLVNDRKAFKDGLSQVEESLLFPDGEFRTLITTKVRFYDEYGDVFILGVASDITDIKTAQTDLLKSEQRYELSVKGSSVGLWDYDTVSGELYWSDRFKEMLGVTTEFNGELADFSDLLHADDRPYVLDALDKHLKNEGPYKVDYRMQKIDGSYIWIHAEGQALWNEKGEPVRMAGSVEDITERKQKEIEREKLINDLAKSNEGLEHFAFICSHDLQEPLRIIRSFSERLQKHMGDSLEGDEKAELYFKFIVDGAARAQVLIADILAYSRLENDTQVLEDVSAEELVEAVKKHLQIGLDDDQRLVTYDPLPMLSGNKTQLYQLLQNLINNGLKYQAAGVKPEVHISATDSGDGFWCFSVKDNGIGIEPRYQKQIFDVFKRLHGQSEYAGTGVGLAICTKVVERHGGRLWVESEKGSGSTFFFRLPKPDDSAKV
ncbi:PAS domain S-box protein [Eionea flava]